ncbi:MAG: nuclear transport factor 2 family protein [Candidatus Rokubacteria bacterium]|nr:nuclear transport factor 2 family protein [Candidatus Rokubacteria bacterium]
MADNAQTMQRMADGFARRDVDQILECFADDGVFELTEGPDPWGERVQGTGAIRVMLEHMFKTLPDIQFADATRWIAGNRGVSEWTCIATTPKGRRLEVRGCDLFTFRDGKVLRKDSYFKKVVRPKA